MDELTTTPAAEPSATTPVESTPPAAEDRPRAPDGKFASKEAAPPAETSSATTEQTEPEQNEPEKAEKEQEPKRNRAAERISQLTAEKHAAQREAAALRSRLEALQRSQPAEVDPNDYEAVQREGMRQVIREETTQQTVQQYQDAVEKARQATIDTFNTKVDAARERIPDIDRSVQEFLRLPVSPHAAEIIAESELSAEIAHYLAANPGEAHRIHQMTPAQQGRELARIEAKVSLPVKKTSKAPPPPPSVTGAQPARQKTPQEESALEYMTRRQKELNGGGR
jgi:hypothetical protein